MGQTHIIINDKAKAGVSSIFKIIRNVTALARILPTFDLSCEEKTVGGSGTGGTGHWSIVVVRKTLFCW